MNGNSGEANGRAALAALDWLVAMGADEATGDTPIDRRRKQPVAPAGETPPATTPPRDEMPRPRIAAPSLASSLAPSQGAADARAAAAAATTLDELRAALENFEGCVLKQTATNLVFARGNPRAPVMLIGEAPGADEDREGAPFVGASGRLLDSILHWAGIDPDAVYIANIVFWRPPGNRSPTDAEIGACLPFVRRHIALVRPRLIVLLGRPAMNTVLSTNEAINRARGRWIDYADESLDAPIPAIPIFHPAYVLRNPEMKREIWMDFLALRERLDALGGKT